MKFSVDFPIDRSDLFERLEQEEIVLRYRRFFHLGDEIGINEIKKHATLEAELTDELLATTPENRNRTFSRAYSDLYANLPWLAGSGTHSGAESWSRLLRPGARIYEIGSGAGYLINFLARNGFNCVGADISSERTELARASVENLVWDVTDGVHLTNYAELESFDYIISDQVVEHLHPDDLTTHFEEARKLLKFGGEYVFRTPYALLGPADLSTLFDCDKPIFMHLHEFNFSELISISRRAGFRETRAIFSFPKTTFVTPSRFYTKYAHMIDIAARKSRIAAQIVKNFHRYMFIRTNILMTLTK